jgi:hypothetical protein
METGDMQEIVTKEYSYKKLIPDKYRNAESL